MSTPSTTHFGTCDTPFCNCPRAIDIGFCERCRHSHCAEHAEPLRHPCSVESYDGDEEDDIQGLVYEFDVLRKSLNVPKLLERAAAANEGMTCSLLHDMDNLSPSVLTGTYISLELRFTNGTIWLVRIPRRVGGALNSNLQNRILLSECATLRWLETVNISTPRLHGYGLHGDQSNYVGVPYLLIDKLPGRPFAPHRATKEQTQHVLSQYANVLIELSRHPFDKIGSLVFDTSGTVELGPITGDRSGAIGQLGPFQSACSYYRACVDVFLALVANRQLCSRFSSNAYLILKQLRALIRAEQCMCSAGNHDSGSFFLHHSNDGGDHILVDDEHNIVGIVEWSFARSVPACEAFGPSLIGMDMQSMFQGHPGRTIKDEILSRALAARDAWIAEPASYDDRVRCFLFGIAAGSDVTWEETFELFRGVMRAFGDDQCFNWAAWRRERTEFWGFQDEKLTALLVSEQKFA